MFIKKLFFGKLLRKICLVLCISFLFYSSPVYANELETALAETEVTETASSIEITSESAILMEALTGKVLFENNADEVLSPASITKIMTLILIFDALHEGEISLNDMVTTSAYAKSMGGSQVFLEEGEKQTVETLIKCIVVASGNDASVAMAEYISGSEEEFVVKMNEKAAQLNMTNTNFEDCCGLADSDNHYTSARDVALMSRYLITNYPEISDYSSIWMETIIHKTNKGESEFVLSNTNKLLKMNKYVTGLKTGSTSKAKYCLSATAQKDNVELIAVIMAAPDYKTRFSEANQLINYGFSCCRVYTDTDNDSLNELSVKGAIDIDLKCKYEEEFSYAFTNGENNENVTKEISFFEEIKAPVDKGDIVGTIKYYYLGETIGEVNIVADEKIEKAGIKEWFLYALSVYFCKQ